MTQIEAALKDRVVELERRLQRIASELRAAGVLEAERSPRHLDDPRLSGLTSRQRQILTRLLQGQRVPAIASELFVSASTVRNHLTAIFRMVGVHSQSELIQVLNGRSSDSQGSLAAES